MFFSFQRDKRIEKSHLNWQLRQIKITECNVKDDSLKHNLLEK